MIYPTLRDNGWLSLGVVLSFALPVSLAVLLTNLGLGLYYLWVDHKKLVIRDAEGPYLTRWHLLKTPWFRIFLHRIHRADKDRDPHNHPWPRAFAFVLKGGYTERVTKLDGRVRIGDTHFNVAGRVSYKAFRPGCYHRIVDVLPGTWTLFFAGSRSRDWGFLVDTEHTPCRTYLNLPPEHDFGD